MPDPRGNSHEGWFGQKAFAVPRIPRFVTVRAMLPTVVYLDSIAAASFCSLPCPETRAPGSARATTSTIHHASEGNAGFPRRSPELRGGSASLAVVTMVAGDKGEVKAGTS